MKTWIKGVTIGGGVAASVIVGGGVMTGIILPKAIQARNGLEKLIPSGGTSRSLKSAISKDGNLKIVALGDSETAGYNAHLGGEYVSYADVLASEFKKAGVSIEYNNLAKSGLKLTDVQVALENPAVKSTIAEADIIPITIGANDILAVLNFFHIPYNIATGLLSNASLIVDSAITGDANSNVSKKTKLWNGVIGSETIGSTRNTTPISETNDYMMNLRSSLNNNNDAGFVYSKEDSKTMLDKSIEDMIAISKGGNSGQFLNIDEDLLETVFEQVKGGVAILVKQLHDINPHAKLVFIGHSLPFAQFPDKVLNDKNVNNGNLSILENFDKLMNAMEDGAKTTTGASNDYVDFYKADDLKYMKELMKERKVDYTSLATYQKSFAKSIMPTITDIHPSVLGQEKIGSSLFSIYAKEAGIKESTIQNAITKTEKDIVNEDSLTKNLDSNKLTIEKKFYSLLDQYDAIGKADKNLLTNVYKSVTDTVNKISGAGTFKTPSWKNADNATIDTALKSVINSSAQALSASISASINKQVTDTLSKNSLTELLTKMIKVGSETNADDEQKRYKVIAGAINSGINSTVATNATKVTNSVKKNIEALLSAQLKLKLKGETISTTEYFKQSIIATMSFFNFSTESLQLAAGVSTAIANNVKTTLSSNNVTSDADYAKIITFIKTKLGLSTSQAKAYIASLQSLIA